VGFAVSGYGGVQAGTGIGDGLKICVLYSYYSAKICFANHEKEKAAGIFPPLPFTLPD